MYSVFLIDDEPWTLEGISETFNWGEFNFTVAGKFTQATKALQEILEKKPDVVFTDIRMPVINGIDILRAIRKNNINTEVIIISGYGQFDYAQEAIREGAFDYCLKPLDEGETNKLLSRLKNKLDQKTIDKNKKIIDLIIEEPKVIDPKEYGIPFKYRYYQVVVHFGVDNNSLDEFLHSTKNVECVTLVMSHKKYYIMNTNFDMTDQIKEWKINENVGISHISESVEELPALISQAEAACAETFLTNQQGTYRYRDSQTNNLVPIILRATKLLDGGQLVDFENLVEQLPDYCKEKQLTMEDICFIWNRIVMHIELIFHNKFQKSTLEVSDWEGLVDKYQNCSHLINSLLREVRYIYGKSDFELEKEGESSSFNLILKYLNDHYNETIKLKDLSQKFFINKNYACYLFKHNTGMTFSEYLNKIRMDQAKELLVTTLSTIAEISDQVGYSDYFYFNKLFKKTFGITPSQYRKSPLESEYRLENTGDLV